MCEGHTLCLVPTSKTSNEPGSLVPVTGILMNRWSYRIISQVRNQDFDAVLVNVHREHDEQLDATFIGTAVLKRDVGEVVGLSTVISTEVRNLATWCLT